MCPGDRLIAVNGQSVEGYPHESVSSILKDISHQGKDLMMVIARVKLEPVNSDNEEEIVSDTDVCVESTDDDDDGILCVYLCCLI